MTLRFLHTADLQLGMTRHYLGDEAQARFTDARFEAICELGRLSQRERCEFVVVCGDVFETNQVDRKTVARACEALASIAVPVFLLPGNHDPLDAASVFLSSTFAKKKPPNVTVLDDTRPREVRPGVEVVGAPWSSKRPLCDLAAAALAPLPPAPGVLRVLVAHGSVDVLSPEPSHPATIRVQSLEQALAEGRVHYAALGDRHSVTPVGDSGRIWYAGSPVATDFGEVQPNHALVVELTETSASVTPHEIGKFRFVDEQRDLANDADLAALETMLDGFPHKERTILKLSLQGTLTLLQKARLDQQLDHARDLFASVQLWDRHTHLAIVPADADFADLSLGGFARDAVAELRALAASGAGEARTARDALALLLRLSGERT